MNCAYFDCFSGVAGDMTLAALLDVGVPIEQFRDTIRRLGLADVTLSAEKVKRHGIAATYVRVVVDPNAPKKHRHLHHIVKIIEAADLPADVASNAIRIFTRLAEAEALVHATTVEKVHFHEVGAADAIVDIVCTCAGLAHLGVEKVVCSPIPTGSGTVTCDHGVMPIPAPATAQLLRGIPIAACEEPGELATPTGVAIVATLATEFGAPPAMTVRATGIGSGTREGRTRPNVMRILIGDTAAAASSTAPAGSVIASERDTVTVLEAQIDDSTGQALAFAVERLLERGALDAFLVPIIMKKGRPGHLLTVLCQPTDAPGMEAAILRETTTLGVRRYAADRAKLSRDWVTVQTAFGDIRVKVASAGGMRMHAWPEFDDCAAAARRSGAPLLEVQNAALRALPPEEHGR